MDFTSIMLLVVVSILVGFAFAFLMKRQSGSAQDSTLRVISDLQSEVKNLHSTLQGQVVDLSRQMNTQWQQHAQLMQETQEGYTRTVGQVQHRLGELHQGSFFSLPELES